MKREADLIVTKDKIAHAVGGIGEPRNYLTGACIPTSEALPGNILLFSRLVASQLMHRERHHHHRFLLLTALKGTGRVFLDTNSYFLNEGEALLFFPFQYHAYMDIEPDNISWLFITFEITEFPAFEPLRNAPPRRLGEPELLLLSELVKCWQHPVHRSLLPLHLALLLARLSSLRMQKPLLTPAASADALLLERLNAFLIPRLNQPLGVSEIAAALGISESHLRARFRSATGGSLGRHLRTLRIQRASSLLHTTRLPISEISEQCGFDSLYSFSRAFKTERGISPRDYRRESDISASPGRQEVG